MYSVVADVSRYQTFVPWCKASKILKADENAIEAELVVGFGYFNEKYISEVTLSHPTSVIAVSRQTSLLEYLRTEWKFTPSKSDPQKCWISFQIDFKFKSALYNQVSEMFLQEIVKNMVHAFETQCQQRFGDHKKPGSSKH
jgi:ribosome-associated toxin RatA of RatAB toxin-antitoxin module